jgi:hypothetical protein
MFLKKWAKVYFLFILSCFTIKNKPYYNKKRKKMLK